MRNGHPVEKSLRQLRWSTRLDVMTVRLGRLLGLARPEGPPEEDDGFWSRQQGRHIELVRFISDAGVERAVRVLDVGCGQRNRLPVRHAFGETAGCGAA